MRGILKPYSDPSVSFDQKVERGPSFKTHHFETQMYWTKYCSSYTANSSVKNLSPPPLLSSCQIFIFLPLALWPPAALEPGVYTGRGVAQPPVTQQRVYWVHILYIEYTVYTNISCLWCSLWKDILDWPSPPSSSLHSTPFSSVFIRAGHELEI